MSRKLTLAMTGSTLRFENLVDQLPGKRRGDCVQVDVDLWCSLCRATSRHPRPSHPTRSSVSYALNLTPLGLTPGATDISPLRGWSVPRSELSGERATEVLPFQVRRCKWLAWAG